MKIFRFFALGAIFPFLISCTAKAQDDSVRPASDGWVISARFAGNPESRTVLDADYTKVLWMPRESISVFGGSEMAMFTSDNTDNAAVVHFRGQFKEEGTAPSYGLYPYNKEAAISSGVISTYLPAAQEGTAGSFADKLFISIGKVDNDQIDFFNVCSGFRFMLDRSDVSSVKLLSNAGEPLAGKFSVGFDKDGIPDVKSVTDGVSEITLNAPGGKAFESGVWYYLVTLPVDLQKGYTFILEGDGVQGSVRSSNAIVLHRNKFRSAKLGADRVDYKTRSDYDIENAGVRAFLENVDYSDDPNYTRSEVSNYPGTDKPMPVKLSWTGNASTIRISTSPDLSGYKEIKVDNSPASVYNLIPGVRYYYSVLAADGQVLKESCVIPEGPMRMINGLLKNSRDLGGWKAGDKTIRYGKIYRGANLDDIQSDASKMDIVINWLGVSVDLDLRGMPPGSQGGSGEKNPWRATDPVIYKNIKLWHYFVPSANKSLQVETSPGETAHQYQYAIRCIIEWLRDGKVVYFHCHGGADRTGTLAFLLEGLLGVSESDIAKDFELTTYSNSIHRRNSEGGWFYRGMVNYIRSFAPGKSINEQVTAWAKMRHSDEIEPLTDKEIEELKALMLE